MTILPSDTTRFLLAPDLWAILTLTGGPVRSADLRMLRRYLALAEEAIAEPPEARHPPKEDGC
jgi:hypothetical protein